ncbi:MAG: shikimate kinase [Clostridiaceae bacterium]|nr:shikimate kinase [Clostridiaceae bacterium]
MKSNIVLIGLMGSGKTTIGKKLSKLLNMKFVDVDQFIEEQFGLITKLFEKGEEYFRNIESKAVELLSSHKNSVISTGGGVVLRPKNISQLKQDGLVFYLDRPIEDIIKTVNSETRPLLKNGREILYNLRKVREPLYIQYCDYHINNVVMNNAISKIISIYKQQMNNTVD